MRGGFRAMRGGFRATRGEFRARRGGSTCSARTSPAFPAARARSGPSHAISLGPAPPHPCELCLFVAIPLDPL
eukprot:599275-Prorocentrum_minimum.AAC.1